MDTIKRLFSGLMWAAWFFLAALMFSLNPEYNSGYGVTDGVIVPILGWLFALFAVISLVRWFIQFFQDRKKYKAK